MVVAQARRRQRAARLRRRRCDLSRVRATAPRRSPRSPARSPWSRSRRPATAAVWAGAMPGNKLWKIDVGSGKATAAATLGKDAKDVETIWSLAAVGDTVYAGTGSLAASCSRSQGGTAKEVFDTDDKRITALTTTRDGAVWLGTSERALVFRFDPKDGKTPRDGRLRRQRGQRRSPPYRDGVVAAANDLAEQPPAVGKTADAGRGRREADRREGPGREDARRRHQARRRQGSAAGHRPRSQGREEGQGRAVPHRRRRPPRSAARADRDVLHVGRRRQRRRGLRRRRRQGPGLHGRCRRRGRHRVRRRRAQRSRRCGPSKAGVAFATDDTAALYRTTGRASARRATSATCSTPRRCRGSASSRGSRRARSRSRPASGNTAKPGVGWSEWQVARADRQARRRQRGRQDRVARRAATCSSASRSRTTPRASAA